MREPRPYRGTARLALAASGVLLVLASLAVATVIGHHASPVVRPRPGAIWFGLPAAGALFALWAMVRALAQRDGRTPVTGMTYPVMGAVTVLGAWWAFAVSQIE